MLGSLYEEIDGETVNVSVTNGGEPMVGDAGAGPPSGLLSQTFEAYDWHALSSDGSRVFFTAPLATSTGSRARNLYLRENVGQPQSPVDGQGVCTVPADACTVEVSASQRSEPDPHGPFPARYRGASADGSRVFFTSRMELTEDAYTGLEDDAANLYEYDLERPEGKRLKDLTVDTIDPEGAGVLGVVQMSEDGSVVYFVAKGVLSGGEENSQGATAEAGQANLYVISKGGAPKFIATLENGREDKGIRRRTQQARRCNRLVVQSHG